MFQGYVSFFCSCPALNISQCYPELLSQVLAKAWAKVQGLQEPSVCQALVKCNVFCQTCFWIRGCYQARPGGHPVKLEMAPPFS